ncbi:poly(ADP-ribose) glycohydrolase-like isoform X2 [Ptychodera flava]|uniref:poly(ADP-ribose) glycohydrolase-like isoform X2 n=1 Tax=Ptychodera flava TaxID=63121 RepID=UPI00396A8ECB
MSDETSEPKKKRLRQSTIFDSFKKQTSREEIYSATKITANEGQKTSVASSASKSSNRGHPKDSVCGKQEDMNVITETGLDNDTVTQKRDLPQTAEKQRTSPRKRPTSSSPQRNSPTRHQNETSPYFQSAAAAGNDAVASTSTADGTSSLTVKATSCNESPAHHSDVSETLELDGSLPLFTDSDTTDIESQELAALVATNTVNTRSVSRGTSMSELNRMPDCSATLPNLKVDKDHVVLFRPHLRSGDPPRPWPDSYKDYWDADHVKMPCSKENLYPVEDGGGQKKLRGRWELIQETLLGDIRSTLDLEEAILRYNSRYSNKWDFRGLHCFFTEVLDAAETMHFFKTTLPAMIRLALQLPNICTRAPPLLKRQQSMSITLSQQQVACLLANAFFCTFPRRNAKQKQSEYSTYPDINFAQLFRGGKNVVEPRKVEKLKCILNYFKRVTTNTPTGTVTFTRRVIQNFPRWDKSSHSFTKLHVSSTGTIEDDGQGMLQVDFANKYIGGGVLGWGCVQEEIRFMICPEMIISRLFTEVLDNNECLVMKGCERFSNYTGYSDSFRWAGDFQDKTPRDQWGRLQTEVVAIDAIHFRNSLNQFKIGMLKREFDKAYCGFYGDGLPPENLSSVATGNWGCGAFGGDPRLKALIQMMAASAAKRDLVYFTFNDPKLAEDIHNIHTFIKTEGLTVGDVWAMLKKYQQEVSSPGKKGTSLYQFMYRMYHDCESSTDGDEKEQPTKPWENDKDLDLKGDESPDYGKYTP